MKFRTELIPEPSSLHITHEHQLLSLGSCFADSIGSRLVDLKFNIKVNPFGTLYNPVSISNLVTGSLKNNLDIGGSVIERDGLYYSWHTHSHIRATSESDLKTNFAEKLEATSEGLKQADFLFVTLGSAFAWQLKSTGQIIANCHKKPSQLFERILLSQQAIYDSINDMLLQLYTSNPGITVIFTVSPVRHIRDGLVQNNRSKAILLSVVHQLNDERDNVHYFPAYELLMDDLRDYRFYDRDLVHPNSMATDYIFNKFGDTYFNDYTQSVNKAISKLNTRLSHRPMHLTDSGKDTWQEDLKREIENFKKQFPEVQEEFKLD